MRALVIGIVLVLLSGCVNTKLVSYRDPSFSAGYQMGKIVFLASELPLEERVPVGTKFVEQFKKIGIQGIRGMDLFPPTRSYTEKQKAEILRRNGITSVLMMVGYSKTIDSTYVPQTYHSGTTTGTISYVGNTAYLTTQNNSYTTGGYTIKKPHFTYKLNLHEVRSGKIVWTANGTGRGSAFAKAEEFGHSTAATTIRKMTEEGLLKGTK